MKYLIIFSLIGFSYYLYTHHSALQSTGTDPYFAEIRIENTHSDLSPVGFGRMNSLEDCQARSAMIWGKTFENIGETRVDTSCKKELSEKCQRIFENQTISATYVVFDKATESERDGRFVIYGIPSSVVSQECSKIIERARQSYTGKIYCIQGSVG